jgi:hypothetical protein
MTSANYKRLEAMLGRAYTLAAQVLNGEVPEGALAEEISGECAELLALMDGDMGAFDEPELIDPELLALASALQPKGESK